MHLDPCAPEDLVAQQPMQESQPELAHHAPGDRHPARLQRVARAEGSQLALTQRVIRSVQDAARAILTRLADLPYDSRDQLHSEEYELARLGLSWASDPDHDAALAHEITIARQQRLARESVAGNVATAGPGRFAPALVPGSSRTGREPDLSDVTVLA